MRSYIDESEVRGSLLAYTAVMRRVDNLCEDINAGYFSDLRDLALQVDRLKRFLADEIFSHRQAIKRMENI